MAAHRRSGRQASARRATRSKGQAPRGRAAQVRRLSQALSRELAAGRPCVEPPPPDPPAAAEHAGLTYVSDDELPIRRVSLGSNRFRYLQAGGSPVRDPQVLERIRKLAIPPAWREVRICARADGHIQAVGRDARGRKQYRYHPRWRQVRDATKYARLVEFARQLPAIRRRVQADLAAPGLGRSTVLATVVRLLDTTWLRVGGEEYARENRHYGLTTLRDHHVKIHGPELRFCFTGKSGIEREVGVHDRRLARIVRACQELPGQRLFQYLDESGERQSIASEDVNDYLAEITPGGGAFTSKDFRTWAGTVLAVTAMRRIGRNDTERLRKRDLIATIDEVAGHLGNTRAVCRASYIHPLVIEAFDDGSLFLELRRPPRPVRGLGADERFTLALLERALPGRKPARSRH